ncbi:MAG: PilZ domain-containing protein [Candidatus Acidiferrales bacterium]
MTLTTPEDRRKQRRILLPEGRTLPCHGIEPSFDGVVSVIGMGGMFIRMRSAKTPGAVLRVRVEDSDLTFQVECTVRDAVESGVGVEFTKMAAEDEGKLKDLLHRLRP